MRVGAGLKADSVDILLPEPSPAQKKSIALDFQGHLQSASKFLEEYQYHDALIHLSQASRLKPGDYQVLFRIGKIYQTLKEPDKAQLAFERVIGLEPMHMESLFELAKINGKQKKCNEALKYVNRLLDSNPDHMPGIKLKVQILVDSWSYDLAEALLRETLEKNENNFELSFLLAWVLYHAKRWDEATELFQELLIQEPEDKHNLKFYVYLIYQQQSRYEEALGVLQDILQTKSGTYGMEQIHAEFAKCLCMQANSLYLSEDIDGAMACLSKARDYNPYCAEIYRQQAQIYQNLNQWEEAISAYQQLIQLDPKSYQSYLDLAALYESQNRFAEAIEITQSAEGLNPSASLYYYLGTLYGLEGELENCIHYLNRATRKDTQFTDAFYNLAVALEQKGNLQEAYKTYQRVLDLDKTHVEAKANAYQLKRRLHIL